MSQHDVVAGLATALRVLLGDKIADEMEDRLGEQNAIAFARIHALYDHLSEKHPDSDPVAAALDDTAPSFDSFDEYVAFLRRMVQKTAQLRVTPGPEFHKLLVNLVEIAEKAKPKDEKTAHAAVVDPQFQSVPRSQDRARLGRTLPEIPLRMRTREALPYSYPSYDATMAQVLRVWDTKHYASRMQDEMNSLVRNALQQVVERIRHTEHVEVSPSDLVIAAQEYLVTRNWIRFGLEHVGEVSLYNALSGYDHDVTVDGEIVLSPACKVHYELIGANLERVLRRVIFNLERDVMSGTFLAGRQPGVDVVVACCSELVQDEARQWLANLRENWE